MTNIITVVLFGMAGLCGPICLIVSELLDIVHDKQKFHDDAVRRQVINEINENYILTKRD